MDKLEEYIKAHREEFDSEEPAEQVWKNIRDSLPEIQPEKKMTTSWIWKVAAFFLLTTTVYLLIDRWQNPQHQSVTKVSDWVIDELDEAEQYFLSEIEKGQTQLAAYGVDQSVEKEFMTDLENLDDMYNNLKAEFQSGGKNEKVAEALIQNLRLRMEIINQQLMILERIKTKKRDEDIEI